MRKVLVGLAGVAALALWSVSPVHAAPIMGCPAGGDCNGASVGAELFSLGGNSYQIDLVFDFAGYNGAQTDVLHAVGIKDATAGTVTNASFAFNGTTSGAFTNWTLSAHELSANGCGGGSGGSRLCLEANSVDGAGAKVYDAGSFLTATFSFFFDTTGPIGEAVHVKFLYENAQGKKVGSLGSFDVPFTTNPDPDPNPVPEPATLALVGLGLLGAGIARRRLRR